MKKTILNIFVFAVCSALLTSCVEKRYDCICIDTARQEFLVDAIATTKKRAADKCKAEEISGKFSRTTTCELR